MSRAGRSFLQGHSQRLEENLCANVHIRIAFLLRKCLDISQERCSLFFCDRERNWLYIVSFALELNNSKCAHFRR